MEGKGVIHIGLPELDEETLSALGELVQEAVLAHIFESLKRSEVRDVDVTVRVNRGDTLDLEVEAYLEVPVFVRVDVDELLDEALERAYTAVEKKLRAIGNEGNARSQTTN